MTTLYGIPNCDTIKRARKWLDDKNIAYEFHDYKKAGIDRKTLQNWCKEFGYETLINNRGTTWRKLEDQLKNNINETSAIKIMQENTSVIKRPVLISDHTKIVGFNEADYKSLL